MSKRTIHVTGRPYATLAYVAKHKKDGTSTLKVYPIRYAAKTRQPIDPKDYNKEDLLATFKFENPQAIGTLIHFLTEMKDNAIYIAGQKLAYDDMQGQYEASMRRVSDELDQMEKEFDAMRTADKLKSHAVHIEVGHGIESMPDDVLSKLSDLIAQTQAKRVDAKKGGREHGKVKDSFKEKASAEPASQEQQ